jgi:type I restriction enzyme R subunit
MNQNPEQLARDRIDSQLIACGWMIQNKSSINLHAGMGIAVREYGTEVGPADYVLFVDKKPVGIIEAKRAEEGVHLTVHEAQSQAYAASKLKYLYNDPLLFVYESTGEVTRFTDYLDPKPRFSSFQMTREDLIMLLSTAWTERKRCGRCLMKRPMKLLMN